MNKVAQYYRELVASLTERLKNGERDIDKLVDSAEQRMAVLRQSAQHLGLEAGQASSIADALADWTAQWARRPSTRP
mgnify:CR=1 FL=1